MWLAKTIRSNSRLWIEILGIKSAKRWLCQWKFGSFCYSDNRNSNVQEWQGLPKIQNLISMVWMFSLVAQLFLTLCSLMDCSMPGFPVHHQLPELAQTHVHWIGDAVQLPHPLWSSFFPAFNLAQHESLQMSQFFASGGQSIGVSASTSVLPMNIQDWFPLGLTGLISLQSKGLSRVFSNTTVQKYRFFSTQLSL